jgi:hypothetical protein
MAAIPSRARSARDANDQTAEPERSILVTLYERYGAHMGFGSAAVLLVLGWLARDARMLSAEEGLGYALGLAAISCMLLLLVYPLRKRLKFLKFLGATKNWFRTHMILGTTMPLAALYHCNFTIGSAVSRVALFSALAVACSGFVGRYIYSKIHVGLYGRRATLKDMLARVELAAPVAARAAQFVPELNARLAEFDRAVLTPPAGLLACMLLPFRLAVVTRLQYWKLMRFARRRLFVEGLCSARLKENAQRLEEITRAYVANHLREIRRVAEFTAYQRLFALWHVVHRPFFFILFIAVGIHVFAVHYY